MTRPQRFIIRMVLFLAIAVAIAGALFAPVSRAFMANPVLNSVILGVLLVGIGYIFRQVLLLGVEVRWLEQYQRSMKSSTVARPEPPNLLAPMARMLENRGSRTALSSLTMRSLMDSIGARLDESRDISRYLIGLMVFLGLLGTFWGLLETVTSVGDAIKSLNLGVGDFVQQFDMLKRGLESPLSGMGTAFSSSLFGLTGSLVLGFLDLQAGQAQNRFYNELEEWLSGMTRLGSAGPVGDSDQSVPAYVQALLEQTADSLDNLQRIIARAEESRSGTSHAMTQLAERLSVLTDQMRSEQDLLKRLAEHQMSLQPVLQRLAQMEDVGLDQASRNHLRNIDLYVGRLVEDAAEGRNRMVEDLRGEIKLLARTMAAIADERRRVG